MSGIAGIVRFDGGPTEPALVERMTAAMSFRGPDGIRHRVEGAVALGHCLLRTTPESLDEAQPLASDDGRVLLVLDGRVADPVELRRELEGRGVRLRDRSDAELVLRAYELWGPDCLRRFDGDFAFFAWDARSRTALCARDRMGNRPFHYHWRDGVFAFASDLRALHALPWVKRELNEGFLAEALADEWLSREETFWTGIVRLVAAHRMVVGANGSTPERYWSPDLEAPLPARKESDLAEAYLVILTEEVRRASRSHAPVAIEVSGGLDSSALFSLAARLEAKGSFPAPGLEGTTLLIDDGSTADELDYARAVARFVGQPLREVPPTRMPQEWYRERAEAFLDFPGYRNGAMFVDLRREARSRGCRVVVTGEGGDQWLGGERTSYAEALHAGDGPGFLRLLATDARTGGPRRALSNAVRHGLLPVLSPGLGMALRRAARRARRRTEADGTCPWLSARMNSLLLERRQRKSSAARPCVAREGQRLQLEMLDDPFSAHVLEVNERLNASLGLESRSPYLSCAIVQLAFALPERLRRSGERNKLLHVTALEGLLPRLVLDRRSKAEFSPVVRPQLDALEDAFDRAIPEALREWVDPAGLQRLFRTYVEHPTKGGPVWSLSAVLGCSEVVRAAAAALRARDVK